MGSRFQFGLTRVGFEGRIPQPEGRFPQVRHGKLRNGGRIGGNNFAACGLVAPIREPTPEARGSVDPMVGMPGFSPSRANAVRFVRTMLLLAAGLGVLGCLSPRSRPGGSAAAPSSSGGNKAPTNNVKPFWANNDDTSSGNVRPASNSATDYNGVVAGSLVDSFNRRVPRAYIQVASADGGKPIDMAVENGYFVIPGLTPGKSYMLTARTVDGERKLAGRAQVTPPNARVVIRVSEDLYSGTVPPPPSDGTGTAGPRRDAPTNAIPGGGGGGANAPSPPGRASPPSTDPPPPPLDAPPSEPDRIPPFNAENIAGDKNKDPRRPNPPLINLPNNNPGPPPLPDPDPPP